MEWISQKEQLQEADLVQFPVNPGSPCLIQTIRIREDKYGKAQIAEDKTHTSETEYLEWVEQIPVCVDEPSTLLVMHQRLETDGMKATSLPYGEDTFRIACEQLFQHRSVAHALRRKSTATFTRRPISPWKLRQTMGPAVVYNCKSDTESLATGDDIVLSVTHFYETSAIFAVCYGCTTEARSFMSGWLTHAKASASNPLFLPMMFAELERRRLVNKIDTTGSVLRKKLIDMRNGLKEERSEDSAQSSDSDQDSANRRIMAQGCEAVDWWLEVSALKNGLESFNTVLSAMLQSSQHAPMNEISHLDLNEENNLIRIHTSENIQGRLHDMIVEIESIVRRTNDHLEGMVLAAQIESNYLTRRATQSTITVGVTSESE